MCCYILHIPAQFDCLDSNFCLRKIVSATCPWFEAYRECFLQVISPSDHEFIKHHLACILCFTSTQSKIYIYYAWSWRSLMQVVVWSRITKCWYIRFSLRMFSFNLWLLRYICCVVISRWRHGPVQSAHAAAASATAPAAQQSAQVVLSQHPTLLRAHSWRRLCWLEEVRFESLKPPTHALQFILWSCTLSFNTN